MSTSRSRINRGDALLMLLCVANPYMCGAGCRNETAHNSLPNAQKEIVRALVARRIEASSARATQVAMFNAQIPDGDPTGGTGRVFESHAFSARSIGPIEVAEGALTHFDVVIFPGGSGKQQAATLGDEGKHAVREFVRGGGGYVGVCGGAFLATSGYEWSLGLINAKTLTGVVNVPTVGPVNLASRGWGHVEMELTYAGASVFPDAPRWSSIKYAGGPILSAAGRADLPDYLPLAVFRTEVFEYEVQRCTMLGTPAVLAGRFGKGHVIIFSAHPEASEGLEPLLAEAARAVAR